MKNILIRGKPGSGKTTLVIRIVNFLKNKTAGISQTGYTAGGFYTDLASLTARNDIEIINLNIDNRDKLVEEILKRIQGV